MQLIFASDVTFIIWVQKLHVSITLGNSVVPHPDNQLFQNVPVRFTKRCWCVTQGWMWLMNKGVSNHAAILLRSQNPVMSCEVCWRSLLGIFDKSGVCLLRVTLQYPSFIISRVRPGNILSRKFILLYPLRKLLGNMPFLGKEGLPSPVLPWRYKKNPRYFYMVWKYL